MKGFERDFTQKKEYRSGQQMSEKGVQLNELKAKWTINK